MGISVGDFHTCAVRADGTVWCWGINSTGQLGDGQVHQSCGGGVDCSPMPVQASGLADALGIEAGDYHTCAVRSDGTAWCWGMNNYGKLGDGTTTQRTTPVQVLWP
jgi:alpha-tubulin suppressor-like RCC1 family protein